MRPTTLRSELWRAEDRLADAAWRSCTHKPVGQRGLSETRSLDQAQWAPWLDRIAAYFGTLSIAAFDNPKVRPVIRQWRNKYADTPRTADMGMQVLSRVCAYAVEQGKLTVNPCGASRRSIPPIAPPSSGLTLTLFEPNNPALRRLRTPSSQEEGRNRRAPFSLSAGHATKPIPSSGSVSRANAAELLAKAEASGIVQSAWAAEMFGDHRNRTLVLRANAIKRKFSNE